MVVVEVLDVSASESDANLLLGRSIELPVSGSASESYAVDIQGWVLGSKSPAAMLEVLLEGDVIQRAPINLRRLDIARAHGDRLGAETSGFRTSVDVAGLGRELELVLRVVLQDDTAVELCTIRVRCARLRSAFVPTIQPLLMTTLGRTGSTWLTQLLGQHPRIIAYKPFRCEPRLVSYWMEVLGALGRPASYLQPVVSSDKSLHKWWLGERPFSSVPPLADPEIHRWLGCSHIESLAGFCQSRIQEFYDEVALLQHQPDAAYFVEKCFPTFADSTGPVRSVPAMVYELYPQAREIFLIRDLRDLVCSISSFTKKYAYANFFTDRAANDREYVRELGNDARRLLLSWNRRSARAYLLKYEDLILHPENTLKSILTYLNLDADASTVRLMLETAAATKPEAQKQHQTSSDPLASIGRWERDLDDSLKAECQQAFAGLLEEFGYDERYRIRSA